MFSGPQAASPPRTSPSGIAPTSWWCGCHSADAFVDYARVRCRARSQGKAYPAPIAPYSHVIAIDDDFFFFFFWCASRRVGSSLGRPPLSCRLPSSSGQRTPFRRPFSKMKSFLGDYDCSRESVCPDVLCVLVSPRRRPFLTRRGERRSTSPHYRRGEAQSPASAVIAVLQTPLPPPPYDGVQCRRRRRSTNDADMSWQRPPAAGMSRRSLPFGASG